jgi:TolB-like protein
LVALTRGGSDAPPARITLAVLPFKNLGGDPDRAYIADGLTDDTSASLAQIDPERFGVKGRTLGYKGTTKTAREIGQELAVDYLLESSVRAEGDRLRVTATLTRVRDQEHVWSQTFDRELTSALRLQHDLSEAIAEQIRVRLAGEPGRAPFQSTQNAEAYDAHLRGRYLTGLRTREGNMAAIAQYKRAIALDPNYTTAWANLAFTYGASTLNSDARPLIVGPLARDAAAHALASNPNLADAQLVSGYVNWLIEWDWPKAEAQMHLAIRLDPGNGSRYRLLGHLLSQSGRHAEAKEAMRRARELEPLEPLAHALSSQIAVQAHDYADGLAHARRAVEIDSSMWIGHVMLAQAYERLGQPDLALEALNDAGRLSNGNSKVLSLRGYVLASTGRTREARVVLSTLEAAARERYVPPYAIALVHAGLGDREAVFTWLDRALAERDVHLIYLPVDSKWDAYRDDSRFTALVARCGFVRPAT